MFEAITHRIKERKGFLLGSALILAALVSLISVVRVGLGADIFLKSLDLILLISFSAVYVAYKSKLNVGFILLAITIPICACEVLLSLLISLQTLGADRIDAFWRMSENLSVLIVAAIFSSLGYFLETGEAELYAARPLQHFDIVILLSVFSACLFWPFIGSWGVVIDYSSILLVWSFVLLSLGGAVLKKTSLSVALVDGAVVAFLFGIVFATSFYFISLQELSRLGPLIAISLLISIYGCQVYYLGFFLTIKNGVIQHVRYNTKNWHIVEALAFLIFMFFGPPTIWEAGGIDIVPL